jgi:protein-tyrosine phosphatase
VPDAVTRLLLEPPDGPYRRRADARLHVTFICTGNICRSPMAEKMFAYQISQRGLGDAVRVSSAGTTGWHIGKCADGRASRILRAHGYPTDHCAAQIGADHLTADLVVALARHHVGWLRRIGADAGRIRMLRSFDFDAGAHDLDVDDPYDGDLDDFERVFIAIAAALPGLHDWVDDRLARNEYR